MNWKQLCEDFSKRKPAGDPIGEAYWFTSAWINKMESVNDRLIRWLIEWKIQFLRDASGVIWFLYEDTWTRCRAEVEGELIRFYILEFNEA